MTLHCFNLVTSRKASIAIHHERDVLRHGALPQGPNEQLPNLMYSPFNRWRL